MDQENINQFRFVLKNKLNIRLLVAFSIFVLGLSLIMDIRPVLFFTVFCVVNALFLTYERYVEVPLDLELSTFFTILMTLKYGLLWGILTAVFSKMASMLYNRDFNKNSIFSISSYVLAALLTNALHGLNLFFMGVLVILLVNIYSFLVFRFIVFLSSYELVLYNVSNVIFNIIIIMGFADIVMRIML